MEKYSKHEKFQSARKGSISTKKLQKHEKDL